LGRTARAPDPLTFERPESFALEVQAEEAGFLTVVLYDPLGALRLPDGGAARALAAGELVLFPVALAELSLRPQADSRVGVLALTSERAIPPERLRAALPERIDPDELDPSLSRLALELASALGCTCEALSLTLALE
jgi:hypothetical protein